MRSMSYPLRHLVISVRTILALPSEQAFDLPATEDGFVIVHHFDHHGGSQPWEATQ